MKKVLFSLILINSFSSAQFRDYSFGDSYGDMGNSQSAESGSMIFNSDGNIIVVGSIFLTYLSIGKYTYDGKYINDNFAKTNLGFFQGTVVLPSGNQGQAFNRYEYTKVIQLSNGKYSILGNYDVSSVSSSVKSFYSLLLNSNGVGENYSSIKMDYPNYNTYTPSFYDRANDFVELPDGKIFICGIADYNYPGTKTALTRFNQDGTVDTTFGNNGRLYLTINDTNGNETSGANNVFLQNDKLIIIGTGNINGNTGPSANNDIYMIRLNLDGTYDTTFGNNGKIVFNPNIPDASQYCKTVRDNNGNFYISGYSNLSAANTSPSYQTWIMKISQNGMIDTSFGVNGIIKHNSFVLTGKSGKLVSLTVNDTGVYIAQQYDAMQHGSGLLTGPDIYLSKFTTNGVIDNIFGINGLFYAIGARSKTDMMSDSQNRVLVSGVSYGPKTVNSSVRRFITNTYLGTAETNTSTDDLSYYPNPVQDILTINNKGKVDIKEIQLLSYAGQFIKNINFKKSDKTISVDLIGVPTGNYLLKVNNKIIKIIKK
ncbi:T9SS type A sorting domain-containing protein [Chryseobacterium lactis]|uniref:T9SS type A sorting domain-containing protein n=1 Tax=Chryseobacterium lactis TaxID=1241981 RepID=UPI00162A0314|nr:T9SS type A sorting domain-containing protein [Chryseobacterium lactis]